MSKNAVRTVLVALVAGMVGWLPAPAAQAATGSLVYSCTGSGFGEWGTTPLFQVVVDSDLPATLPYGSERLTTWSVQAVAPEEFRSWAEGEGFTTLYPGAGLGTPHDGVAQPQTSQFSQVGQAVPTTPGPWAWSLPTATSKVLAATTGHHVVTATTLQLTIAFYDADGPAWATGADCTLDPSVPPTDAMIDSYDVVAATTTTTLAVKGDTATATVTSNGAPPAGNVTFSLAGNEVTIPLSSGKATAKLPVVKPGDYTATATFEPIQPTQLTTSTGTAAYTAGRIETTSATTGSYRPALHLVKARTKVLGADGSAAKGRVTFILKRNGVTVDNVTVLLTEGVGKKKFRGITGTGTYLVLAKYLGTTTYQRSSDRARFTI